MSWSSGGSTWLCSWSRRKTSKTRSRECTACTRCVARCTELSTRHCSSHLPMNLSRRAAHPGGTHDRGSCRVSTCDFAWRRLMKHAILGAGAVGGLVGAVLAHDNKSDTEGGF